MITAVIIAKNEEKRIGECLQSLNWVNKIIVIDNNSTDRTASIAKKFNAKVYNYKIDAASGKFSDIRNFALKKIKTDWVLFVDADEIVTTKLKSEIENLINHPIIYLNAYAIPRRNILLGHAMHWGGWWPDYVIRLFRKDKLKGYKGELHEQPVIEGSVGKLSEPFIHTTHENLTEMINKTNKWSEIEARLMYRSGHPPMNVPRFATAMFREFWYRGILKLGFLDGPIGIIEIIYQMFSRFISYSKLWEMQK